MKRSSAGHRVRGRNRSDTPLSLKTEPSDQDYRVGPGRPPKEHQFKPGQSGNPAGGRRRPTSIAPDLKALFERALNEKVTLRQGEREKIITKAAAGIEQLVNQLPKATVTRGATFSLWLKDLGWTCYRARVPDSNKPLRRRSAPMTKLSWPITCSGTPSSPTLQARSRRTTIPT